MKNLVGKIVVYNGGRFPHNPIGVPGLVVGASNFDETWDEVRYQNRESFLYQEEDVGCFTIVDGFSTREKARNFICSMRNLGKCLVVSDKGQNVKENRWGIDVKEI